MIKGANSQEVKQSAGLANTSHDLCGTGLLCHQHLRLADLLGAQSVTDSGSGWSLTAASLRADKCINGNLSMFSQTRG